MNVYEQIFRAFDEAQVQYLVVGGVAVNLYGYLRATGDLDILVLLDSENLAKVDDVMKSLEYVERLPISVQSLTDEAQVREWLDKKNLKAFTFTPSGDNPLQLDIVLEPSLRFEELFQNRESKMIGDLEIPVVSIDDLIEMKKDADRLKDRMDIEALLEFKLLE